MCTADYAVNLNCCLIHVTYGCVQPTINDVKYCDWLVQYSAGRYGFDNLEGTGVYWHWWSACGLLFCFVTLGLQMLHGYLAVV